MAFKELRKLSFYGIRGIPLEWFKSYLSNRTQFVKYNEADSELLFTKQVVPQGSILGPLLFLLFINDIVESSRKLHYVLYADDTNIFYSGKNLNDLIFEANVELQKVANWFSANKLKINET